LLKKNQISIKKTLEETMLNIGVPIIEFIFNFFTSNCFILALFLIILLYHLLFSLTRDSNYIRRLKNFDDSKNIDLSNLKSIPLVNVIIPAWKEEEIFRGTLMSISNLNYPNLNVIVNAGGNEKTTEIANSFSPNKNFTILTQKGGEGKIKAINDCLTYIKDGLVIIMDADIPLSKQDFFNIISPMINEEINVVTTKYKPHISMLNKNLVKYTYINRHDLFKIGPKRYVEAIGACNGMKYDVIKAINKFKEKNMLDDGRSMGIDILSKDFRIYYLFNLEVQTYSFPNTFKGYINQNLRWIENSFYFFLKNNKKRALKFVGLVIISLFFFSFPIFFFFNPFISLLGFVLLFNIYLKRIRRVIFLIRIRNRRSFSLNFHFYFIIIFYIYLDFLINLIAFFELIFYRKAYKKRKNLISSAPI